MPDPIWNRLLIEQFVAKVSKHLYQNERDPLGLVLDSERAAYSSFLADDYDRLKKELSSDLSPITKIYLDAAGLHFRINHFFADPNAPTYRTDLFNLYNTTCQYLESCLNLDVMQSTPGNPSTSIKYCTNYIFLMMLAGGFALLKLNFSFLRRHHMNSAYVLDLFRRTVYGLRSCSVAENDLAARLAEVLAQVWKSGRVRAEPLQEDIGSGEVDDDSLKLRIRARMSMSLVYDSVWRWRQNFRTGVPLESKLYPTSLLMIIPYDTSIFWT